MADAKMRQCPHCFGEVDARATACRHCGGKIGGKRGPRGNGVGCLLILGSLGVVVFMANLCTPESPPQQQAEARASRPARQDVPKLCSFWKHEIRPAERANAVQALVERSMNPYDLVPGCIAHPKNAERIGSLLDTFCKGAGQSDRIVLSGVEDIAAELCGRR